MRLSYLLLAVWLWVLPGAAVAQDTRLVIVEQAGCIYCVHWDRDVAPEYPKTAEGRAAPLRRVDIGDLPEDLKLKSRPVLTPTFILVQDGQEVARLEGYPGEDFFWPLLNRMLDEAGIERTIPEETKS
ncbi:thioredoxin family protein [Tropicimonas sp. S265A]|uniref:thioredoxin family protein n=1 Tax=Tropicimonas sp. S265A TaxID=3415134 RepID=UPI003C7AFD2B